MEDVRTGPRSHAGVPPRPRSHQSETALWRLVVLVLLAIGLSLADLSVVRASELETARAARPGVAVSALPFAAWSASCIDDACHPEALAAAPERPVATRARVSGPANLVAGSTHDILARRAPLATLQCLPALITDSLILDVLPWRPARESGADRSVPRPPPW